MLHFVSNLFCVSRARRWHLRSIMWMNIRASFGVKAFLYVVCVCVSICVYVCLFVHIPLILERRRWTCHCTIQYIQRKYRSTIITEKHHKNKVHHNRLSSQYFLCYRFFKNIWWWWFKQVNLPAHQCIVNLHIPGCLAQGQSAESVMKVQNLVIFSYIHVQSTYFLLCAYHPLCGLFWDLSALEMFHTWSTCIF